MRRKSKKSNIVPNALKDLEKRAYNRFGKRSVYKALTLSVILVFGGIALWQVYLIKHKNDPAYAKSTFSYNCPISSESPLCLAKQYKLETDQKGVAAAFTTLKAAYNTDPAVKADCHQLAHVIGRESADKSKSVADAYSLGDNFCWSGYYHGVMESVVVKIGVKNLDSALPTICAPLAAKNKYSFYHFNCVHGLGHGIMDVKKSDLFASLTTCDLLNDTWEQESCYGGVFMENVMDEINVDHHTVYLKSDQPMYPCTAVGDKYKQSCYLMQTSHALRLAGENFSTVFAECSAIETQYIDTCFQSLGRDASGNSNSTLGPTKDNCYLGQTLEAKQNCIIGAVKDYISYYHSDKQAEELCRALDTTLQPTCETTKVQYYSTF